MKTKGATLAKLQTTARLSRTVLAARLLQHGLYAGQDQIMLALAQEEWLTSGQLAAQLGVRPPTITKTINRLQSQGFVEKCASQDDGRQSQISLTSSGRAAIMAIEKSLRKTEKQALKGFDKKDQRQLIKLLAQIEANLQPKEPEPIEEEEASPEIL